MIQWGVRQLAPVSSIRIAQVRMAGRRPMSRQIANHRKDADLAG
jgi:hypothetical protein